MRQEAVTENLNNHWPTAGNGTVRFRAQNSRQGLPKNPKTGNYRQQSLNSRDRHLQKSIRKNVNPSTSTELQNSNPHSLTAPK